MRSSRGCIGLAAMRCLRFVLLSVLSTLFIPFLTLQYEHRVSSQRVPQKRVFGHHRGIRAAFTEQSHTISSLAPLIPSPRALTSKRTEKLDSVETPVWFRRLPRQPTTPTGPPMSTALQHISVPATEMPSPAPSDNSVSTRQGEQDAAATSGRNMDLRRTPRAGRSPARPPLRTSFRNFSGVATVIVGEPGNKSRPQTQYLVHKELLTSASPFFAAALNGTFAEGMEQVVRLPEEKPECFEWFLQWLYTGTLTTQPSRTYVLPRNAHTRLISHPEFPSALTEMEARYDGDLRNSAGSPKYFLLLDLYALSDRLLTTPLSNHILSTLARLSESTNSVPTPSDTWILYDTIRDDAPLRTLVLDLFAYKKTDKLLETHKDDWHPHFLRQLVVKLKRPGPEAIERHALVAFRPRSWSTSKACEGCKEVLKPDISSDKCIHCDKAFCGQCLRRHAAEGWSLLGSDTSGCKPWMGMALCARYHEHGEGEACC